MSTLAFDTIPATQPTTQNDQPSSWRQRLSQWFVGVQYGRLVQAMNSMSDEHLRRIGITRDEIPSYALKALEP